LIVIAIAGGSCSGKTTLARLIADEVHCRGLTCAVIPLDNYYKLSDFPFERRMRINHDLPEAFDWPLFRAHLKNLSAGKTIEMPLYDYAIHNRTGRTRRIDPPDAAIIEGLYTLHDAAVRAAADLKVFLDCPFEERRERRLRRDIAERGRGRAFTEFMFDNVAEPAFSSRVEPTRGFADLATSAPDPVLERVAALLDAGRDG
jgi:uridine kinase